MITFGLNDGTQVSYGLNPQGTFDVTPGVTAVRTEVATVYVAQRARAVVTVAQSVTANHQLGVREEGE